MPRKHFRCVSEDQLIAKCPNPPKDNEKSRRKVRFNEKGNHARDNSKNNSDQKIYAFMTRMYGNGECPSGNSCDGSQLTNWILDSGATCHITPEVSDFIPGLLEDTENTLKLRTDITLQRNKKVKYENKCATITEILSSQRYTTYFYHQTYAAGYFQSLR